jgi:hypothetical protein
MTRESRVQAIDRRTGPSVPAPLRPGEAGDGLLRVSRGPETYHGGAVGLHAFLRVPLVTMMLGGLVLGACGGDVRSQDDEGSERVVLETAGDTPLAASSPEADTGASEGEEFQAGAAPAEEPTPPPAAAPAASRQRPVPAGAGQGPPATGSMPPERTDRDPPPFERPVPAPDVLPVIPAGTELVTRLTASLDTGVNQAGDLFSARVDEDMLAANGMVMVPRGSEIRGRVLEARESTGPDDPAILLLEVEALVVGGVEIPVVARVVDAEVETSVRDSNTRTAAKVATGAAAGAVLGRLLGRDGRSTTAGAVAGVAAGTAVALATRDGQAVMAPGSRLVIRFDEAVPHLR